MTTTPLLQIPELPTGQNASPETMNEAIRKLEAGAFGPYPIEDDDLLSPPGSPTDGQVYMINGTGAGGWTGHNNSIALFLSTGWVYYSIREGMCFWIKDENKLLIALSASTFQEFKYTFTASDITTAVRTVSGTSDTFVLADANNVVEYTNAGAVTATIPTNASVAFPIGTFIEMHQAGAGAVTPTAAGGVTLDVRSGFSVSAGQYAIMGIRKVATDTWRLTGDLA